MYWYTCIYVYIYYIHICLHMYKLLCIYIYKIHTHIYIYIYIHTYIYIYKLCVYIIYMYTSDIRRWTTFSMGSLPGRPPEAVESTFHGALDALRLGMSRWKPWGRKMWKSCHGENPFGKGQLVGFPHLSENRRLSLNFLIFLTQMPQHLVATFELFSIEPPYPENFVG